ncbi:hypothetical protein TDB9533_01143 [Thalassocella blandensis]|nr:hypothetical protein TDB9533_01143 [Thalassocella blandensis]
MDGFKMDRYEFVDYGVYNEEMDTRQLHGQIVLVNHVSRLAAVEVDKNAYMVFEYFHAEAFKRGDKLSHFPELIGHTMVQLDKKDACADQTAIIQINVLSSRMDWARAKLVVAPWQDVECENDACTQQDAAFAERLMA